MQTLSEIRRLLSRAGLSPARQFGQNFLIDGNLLDKLLSLAEGDGRDIVLEVGPGTGSLTGELLSRFERVVAIEIDRGLYELLRDTLGDRTNLTLIHGDVLSSKHVINPQVVRAVEPAARLIANLPYGIATPLIVLCLKMTWRGLCRIDRMTFTIQQELADRLIASPGGGDYGPLSVLTGLLGRVTPGAPVPAGAFFPKPKVASRILRIDFDASRAARLADVDVLAKLLSLAFAQRRKQIGSILKRKRCPFPVEDLEAALDEAQIDLSLRAERIAPEQFRSAANSLRRSQDDSGGGVAQ